MVGLLTLPHLKRVVPLVCRRNIGICSVAMQKATDPIQQLFVDKLREFSKKSSTPNFLAENPDLKKQINDEEKRILTTYGGENHQDMQVFPSFSFSSSEIQSQKAPEGYKGIEMVDDEEEAVNKS